MTDPQLPANGDQVLTLAQLISARAGERGWSNGRLAQRCEHALSRARWQQLRTGARMTEFPEPATLALIAEALEVEITTVVLAAAQTLGLDARRRGPDLAHLLPAGTDRLSVPMRDALLAVIRAAVSDGLAHEDAGDDGAGEGVDRSSLEWAAVDGPTSRRRGPGAVATEG